jgi:tellurite methyltransferase
MPSARPNPVSSWHEYFQSMLDKPLHPLYQVLDSYLPESGHAVELGAGVGQGVNHFLQKGWTVLAVDAEPEAVELLRSRFPKAEVIHSRLEDLPLPAASADAVVAGFVLFFLEPADLERKWAELIEAIKPSGLFAGQFLGQSDDWAAKYTAHSREEITRMLEPFDVLHFEEVERDGETSHGLPKHWHVFHVVARKRPM